MQVTFVANRLNVTNGGSDLSLDLVARSLVDRSHEVRVVTINTDAPNEFAGSVPYTVEKRSVGAGASRLAIARSVYRVFMNHESSTDLFHVFNPPFISMGGLYRRRGGTRPVVGRLNNYTIFCTNSSLMDGECHKSCSIADKFRHDPRGLPARVARSPTYVTRATLEPSLINSVDRLFAQSPAVREIHGMNGLDTDLIEVVGNFYDPTFGDGDSGHSQEVEQGPQSEHRLLFVGRLIQTKGPDLLIDALSHLDRADVVLDVVGDGKMREELQRQVDAAGLADCVQFHGWVNHDDLTAYYRNATVFIHPGRWPDPCPRTIMEAMQCGCIPVVTDVGGPPWVVGNAGITVPRDDPAAIATALSDLLGDAQHRETLRERASVRLEEFAPERVLDTIEQLYADVRRDA